MKKVILTGGTGFIGSWLIDELISNGFDVTVLVRDIRRVKREYDCRVNIIEYIPDDIQLLELPQDKYDIFYHLGWGGVNPTFKNDIDMQLANIKESVKAMEYASKIGCGRFIATGTVAEYVFCKDIMDVNAKQTPNDMYGAAKVATHYFLDIISRKLSLPFIWAVVPSTFGERRMDNNIITYTIKSLIAGEKPSYGDLKQMWDFLYVGEVVRALRLIGEKGNTGKTYGIGSGVYKPLREYMEEIRDIINPNLPLGIGELPSMSTQTFSSCVCIDELTKDTGFVPIIKFEEGIKKTISWFKENM